VDEFMSEQEQWEWLKSWLRANGLWILGGIGVGALIVSGWFWWGARTDRLGIEAGAKYTQITEALARGDNTRAQTLTAELERDYGSSPYADQARLLSARTAVEAGELDKAADLLKSIMDKTKDEQLALVARMRLARVQLAQGKADVALATLAAVQPGAFKARFDEVRGDILYAKGDKSGALSAYRAAREGAISQSSDAQLLELKIDDLVADNVTPAATANTEAK
jgi:predicted negative regulator of RcsB-dependent stress response